MQCLQDGLARQEEPCGTLFLKAQHPRLQEVPADRVQKLTHSKYCNSQCLIFHSTVILFFSEMARVNHHSSTLQLQSSFRCSLWLMLELSSKAPKKCSPHLFSCCCPTHKAKSSQRLPRVETWQVSIAASWQRDSLFDVHNHILSSHTLHCFHCLNLHPDHP